MGKPVHPQKPYPEEFKREALGLLGSSGKPLAQIARELGPEGPALVDRLVEGTHHHAVRREHEMRDALRAVEATGEPVDMTRATLTWFQRIVAERRIVFIWENYV